MTRNRIYFSRGRHVLILLGLSIVLPAMASAHAFLDQATPKVGAVVSQSPDEVRIKFTQNIEPAFSTIKVTSADGKRVDKKNSHVDSSERSTLIVSVGQLPPGQYSVAWQVVSVDTHHTRGDFKFTVKL